MVKLLRATPVVLPYKEVSAAFSEGRIDCAEGSMVSYEATGHYKPAKFMYLSNHQVTPEALVISTKAWKKICGTDQAEMRDAGRKTARSEEHTSELQSLLRNTYAVDCLKKKQVAITPQQ